MIEGVAFIAYAVRDVSKAAAFYRDVVGLRPGEIANDEFVEFQAGSTTFAIDAAPAGYEPGSCNGVSFEADDVAAERARLAECGVPISDVYEFPTCSMCFAKDPDGNGFGLHRRKE